MSEENNENLKINFRNNILKSEENIVKQQILTSENMPFIENYRNLRFEAKNVYKADSLLMEMYEDKECSPILVIGGSMISSGVKPYFVNAIKKGLFKCVVSTGANIIDQDLFEAMGFKHYKYDFINPPMHWSENRPINDNDLMELKIDRIYDTIIDEIELKVIDEFMYILSSNMENRPYSSSEIINTIGAVLDEMLQVSFQKNDTDTYARISSSLIWNCYKLNVPIFVPALNDCCAGFGFVKLIHERIIEEQKYPSFDGMLDFYELTKWKMMQTSTGLFMLGGGVVKNYIQDTVVCGEYIADEGIEVPLHKYSVQVSVADQRDGGLSGSTLSEANTWGKVDVSDDKSVMVWCEASIAIPIIFNRFMSII